VTTVELCNRGVVPLAHLALFCNAVIKLVTTLLI